LERSNEKYERRNTKYEIRKSKCEREEVDWVWRGVMRSGK
jgi:hypothetical protein